jgi:hypothetical protein
VARRAAVPPRTIFIKDVSKRAGQAGKARGKIEKFLSGVGLHIQTVHYQYFMNENIFPKNLVPGVISGQASESLPRSSRFRRCGKGCRWRDA